MIGTMVFSSSGNYIVGASEKQNAEFQRKCQNKIDKEGLIVNCEYGGDEQTVNWCYYNSDYYYQCEETHQFLKNITQKMAEQWSIPSIDIEDVENKSKLTLDGNFDFNSGWSHHFRRQHSRSSMEDESLTPPKGFKM